VRYGFFKINILLKSGGGGRRTPSIRKGKTDRRWHGLSTDKIEEGVFLSAAAEEVAAEFLSVFWWVQAGKEGKVTFLGCDG